MALRKTFLVASAILLAIAVTTPAAASPPPGSWQTLSPLPKLGIGVEGLSVSGVGNKIVAAFGYDQGDRATTRIYDIAGDTWSLGANGPGTNSEGVAVTHGGLVYSLGGRSGGARADLWSYHVPSDTWKVLPPMPTPRAGLAAAVVGNAIYAIGGRSATGGPCSGGALSAVERYDIDSGTWSTVAPLLSVRSDLAAAVVGNKIYVFGGCTTAGSIVGSVDVYDPVTDTWSAAPADMPTARAAFYTVAVKGSTVYAIGGWDGVSPGLPTVESYKVPSDTWSTGLPPMPTARAEHGAVGHGGRIYVVGGAKPGFGASVDANEVFKP